MSDSHTNSLESLSLSQTPCPYCRRVMRWTGNGRRAGSGWLECDHCGTFDVYGDPRAAVQAHPAAAYPVAHAAPQWPVADTAPQRPIANAAHQWSAAAAAHQWNDQPSRSSSERLADAAATAADRELKRSA